MRAFIVPNFGDPGSIGERPMPEPAEGQILVKVKAAGVNAMDPVYRAGWFKDYMEHRLPLTPGTDYAGTVTAVGPSVEGFAIGDEVFGGVGKPYAGEGSFAEFVTVTATLANRRPEALPAEQAAALTQAGTTALSIVDALGGSAGDSVAVIGAAGGVGVFTVQLAARRGYRVIAVTTADQADVVRAFGASHVVDYASSDVPAELRRLAPDGLAAIADLYHDAAGAGPLAELVRPGGALVSPVARGLEEALGAGPVAAHVVAAAPERAAELADLAVSGGLVVPIEILPLDRAGEALDRQASKTVHGKLVLTTE